MKNLAAIALLSAAILSLAPTPAIAGSKEKALIGGLIGGLILGHAISESYHSSSPPERGPVVVYDSRSGNRTGYWMETRVQIWVPGCWITTYTHNRPSRRYVAGHHEYRTERVWVTDARHNRHHSDRYAYNR